MIEPQFYKGAIDASGCISNAWNMIKPNYWLYFGISLVTLLISFGISCIPIVGVALLGPVMGGVYYVALRAMRGDPVDFGMMFKGFEKFVPLLIISVIQGIPSMIGQILNMIFRVGELLIRTTQGSRGGIDYYQSNFQSNSGDLAVAGGMLVVILVIVAIFSIFSIAWAITFAFAVPIAMDQDVDAITAIKLSARAGWSNIGGIIILAILLGLIFLASAIAICVGGPLWVLPIINVSWAFAYRQVFPDLAQRVYRNEPPPPDAYGGSFGRGM